MHWLTSPLHRTSNSRMHMKVEEDFSSRERREREALEESDMVPRITLAESDGKGWHWTASKLVRWLTVGLITGGCIYTISAHAQSPTPTPVPTTRLCKPLFIDGIQCGKLCKWPDKWAIRGCQPLNKLIKP